jgi:integrase
MATAAALAFELVQRVSDCFGFEDPVDAEQARTMPDESGIRWEDYLAGHRITVRQQKTGKLVTIPLTDGFGPDRANLYPELEDELGIWAEAQVLKTGLIIVEERNGQPYKPRWMSEIHRRICDAAKLPKDLTFTSFRHGGATELGDAGETDIRSISGHTQLSTTLIYNQANQVKARRMAQSRRKHIQLIAGHGESVGADDA